jgi:tetratricopeptide (TPR) repeat protein
MRTSEVGPSRWSSGSGSVWFCLFIGLIAAAIAFRWNAVQSINKRTPDERVYAVDADAVAQSGVGAIRGLVNDFITTREQWIYPPPTRVGYICLVAAIEKITGTLAEKSAVFLSFAFSCLTFFLTAVIGLRFFDRWPVLLGLAFLAVSPIELALAGRGWQDAIVGGLGILLLYLAMEKSIRLTWRWWDVFFWLVAFLFLLIKESALVIFAFCIFLLIAGAWRQRTLSWKYLLHIAIPSVAVILLGYGLVAWCSGGFPKVLQVYQNMTEGLRLNPYVYLYQSGPWYSLPLGFWFLSPASTFLGLLGIIQLFLRRQAFDRELNLDTRQSAAVFGMAFFVSAVLIAATLPDGLKNLRYVSVVDGPVCLIGGLLFARVIKVAATQFTPPRWKIAIGVGSLALLLVCLGDFQRFKRVFVRDGLEDLPVVRLVNFVVTYDDMPFELSRPFPAANRPPAAKAHVTTPEEYLTRSYALYQRGSYREAIIAARLALRKEPGYAEAWNNIGASYNQLGQYSDAAAAFEQALRLRPNFVLAQRNLKFAQDMMKKSSSSPEKNGR